MFDHDRDYPRAYTVPEIPHKTASALGVKWAVGQSKNLGAPVSLYVPTKQVLGDVSRDHPSILGLMQQDIVVRTWRDLGPASGVVIALWPDEKHLLEADQSGTTMALVAVSRNPKQILPWVQAKKVEPLGGPQLGINAVPELHPVVAVAVNDLCDHVGQHTTVDREYRAEIAKDLSTLREAGYVLDPQALHTHAIGSGWLASNAEMLRDVAARQRG